VIPCGVRVLFTAAPVPSHFQIHIPFALALRNAGHDVALASGPDIVPRIERLGLPAVSVGPPLVAQRPPPSDPAERFLWAWEEYFVGRAAAERLGDVFEYCQAWLPDLVVRENTEFAGCVAAEALGIPHAIIQLGNIEATQQLAAGVLTAWLDDLRADMGLPPDPDLAMMYRYLLLLLVPRSFHGWSIPLPTTARFLRPVSFDRTGDEGLPDWVDALPHKQTVYMTLGTVHNARVDLFALVIDALRDEPLNLIITVGRNQDPSQFGPQPAHVKIERYIPQSLLLPRCDLMINCAGMSSLRTAFEHALPLVLLPLASDHPVNAARCETIGVARVLDPRTASPASVRDAVKTVLSDPSYRSHAKQLQQEMMAMPGPERAVALFEQLATERIPIQSLS
jgi:UDP:flavonoid glycosyltransferase YjiC (YdhE family)